jgi:endonuclease/exonuclease/phosphatase family metal-dependent hydrolase
MKLASYNIRKAVGLDRRRDPARILDVVNQIGADVIVLQEADKRLGPRPAALPRQLIADHTDYEPVDLAINEVSIGWHGNAILVKKGTAVSDPRRITLPGLEPRGAVSAVIAGQIRVVGVHLGLLRRHRHGQLRSIRVALESCTHPTAVLGDFNEWSPRTGLEEFQDHFTMLTPGKSFHASRPIAALDRVGLSPGLELETGGVIQTGLSKVASDHLPVWVKVRVLPREA